MRSHYWTCSKFADWLRGTKYPFSAGFDDWDDIHEEARSAHPFRYWLAETGLRWVQDVVFYIPDTWESIGHYCRNRFIQRVHLIDTKWPPGHWMDTDERILRGVMEALVFYVEIDCGAWGTKKDPREAGLEHLDWEAGLVHEDWVDDDLVGTPTDQAERAMEVKSLYLWWKDERPARLDPYDFVDEEAEGLERYKECIRMEEEQQEEDDNNLIRVIKARHGMWT